MKAFAKSKALKRAFNFFLNFKDFLEFSKAFQKKK